MKKQLTEQDILKKRQTNVKSAGSAFALAGILGLIYIIRYFVTGNFDFYFSLSFTEIILRLSSEGTLPTLWAYILTAGFMIIYTVLIILGGISPKNLKLSLIYYGFDSLCLCAYLIIKASEVTSDCFIDVIIHGFILLFLIVGIISHRKLYAETK